MQVNTGVKIRDLRITDELASAPRRTAGLVFDVIIRRARKSGRHCGGEQRQFQRGCMIDFEAGRRL